MLVPLETERLLIREFDPNSDAAAMCAVYCDPEVMRFIPGGVLDGVDAVRAELERHVESVTTRRFWAVVERRTGNVVGEVGLGVFEDDIELGYTFSRAYWGRGYATEAAGILADAAFAALGAQRIVAVVDAQHASSMRVAQRLGMSKVDCVVRDGRTHMVFAREQGQVRP